MANKGFLVGFDLGSSSVKVSIVAADTGILKSAGSSPEREMDINSPQAGWAEQDPENWWVHARTAFQKAMKAGDVNAADVLAIGISYQMHGLVAVDKNKKVLRPSIIWCDSRAVEIGDRAFQALGEKFCLDHLLNSPGNFTASKLKWVKENEPYVFDAIDKIMLPGDYLAMRLTGEIATTVSGLSEGIFWDYQSKSVSKELLKHYGLSESLIPNLVHTFGTQGVLSKDAAAELGLRAGVPVCYRAGDQPNNAFSLNALNPGEVAATAGTSGVIYGVVDKPASDSQSRVNPFVHVNHTNENQRLGILLCVNGTGIMNSWLRKNLGDGVGYDRLNHLAASAPVGSDGLRVLPFGNGAERMLANKNIGASFHKLDLNRHTQAHLSRGVQEGIVFALGYGFEILNAMGLTPSVIRAGRANMFLSDTFCEAFANVTNARLELFNTDGAQGAARGAGIGAGIYSSMKEAFDGLKCITDFNPDKTKQPAYNEAYIDWKHILNKQLV